MTDPLILDVLIDDPADERDAQSLGTLAFSVRPQAGDTLYAQAQQWSVIGLSHRPATTTHDRNVNDHFHPQARWEPTATVMVKSQSRARL